MHFSTRRGQFPLASRGRHWRVWGSRFYAIHVSDIRRCQVLATCRNRSFKRGLCNSFAYPFQCCASL